jgi:hypothetical protein
MSKRRTKRVKRSHMKRFAAEYISTGRGPNPVIMAEYQARARHVDAHMAKVFGIPNEPRLTAVRKSLEVMLEDVPIERHVAFANSAYYKLFLIYSKGYAFFIECNTEAKYIKRSIHFASSSLAILAHKNKRITWVEELSTFPPELTNSGPPPK